MQVRATQRGYYGQQREPGDEFAIADKKHFSRRWMEAVESEKPAKGKVESKAE